MGAMKPALESVLCNTCQLLMKHSYYKHPHYHTAYLKGMSYTDLFFKNYYSYKLCLKSKKKSIIFPKKH